MSGGQNNGRVTRWTADVLMETVFPEPRWAVPGLVSEGLNMLVGAPKVGKSWLSLNIGMAVATGNIALGSLPVKIGDVLYLALEDTGRRLQSRIGLTLGGSIPPSLLTLETECPVIGQGGEAHICEWIEAHPSCRLIVIDVFARIRGTDSGKGSRYDEDYRQMTRIKEIADAFGVAILVVHHARKLGSGDFLDVVSGTHGLAGAADTIMVLARTRGQNHAILHIVGRDLEDAEHPLAFQGGRWSMLDGQTLEEHELSEARRRILEAIRNLGPMTPMECATVLASPYENVKRNMHRMRTDDQLTADDDGVYSIP